MNSFDAEMQASRRVTAAFNRDTEAGYAVTGFLTQEVEVRDLTDPVTRNVRRFDNGDVMTQYVATIQTELNEYDGDDGLRRIFVKGWNKNSFREAIREAGARTAAVGGKLSAKYMGEDEITNTKRYIFKYEAPKNEQLKLWDNEAA
jgi:hypothetical protein